MIAAIGFACAIRVTGQMADSIGNASFRAGRTDAMPRIDGILDDECWESAGEWSGTFTQQQPDEGKPETEETHVKILYDAHNIYVGFRAYDARPEKINRWTTPRDQMKGDWVGVVFDSYADRRTGFCFVLTAGGTRCDLLVFNSDDDDETWDAVWDGKTSVDDKGWYAEIRIPLSQLRYSSDEVQEWGFHAIRSIDRKQEQSHLNLVPRSNKGYVYSFARLTGISGLPKSRHIELMPYTSFKYIRSPAEEGNPYATGSRWEYGAGLDGKIGLSSDFMLDFTINPDFGQVEADPSTINLTAYETYYDEKRPFFLEGKNIFTNIPVADGAIFYSRRIGSPPSWRPEGEDGQYSYVPQQTHIMSAMKLSGKTKNGLSAGLLNSLTAKESARIADADGREYKMTAQPFASYSAARLQQDFNKGNTVIGGLATAVNRSIKDGHLSALVRNAYTGTFDFEQYFFKRNYFVRGSVSYSHVEGEKEALVAVQRSAVHNFQREGAAHVAVDSSRTHLSGTSGTIRIGKGGESKWQSGHVFSWHSPGFEPNDAGFLQNADEKRINGWAAYVENAPSGIFRRYTIDPFYNFKWDYSGATTYGVFGLEANMSFVNKWFLYAEGFYESCNVDNGMLRGGPPVKLNPRWGTDLNVETDNSKKVWAQAYHGTMFGEKRYAHYLSFQTSYRPASNLGLSAVWDYTYRNLGLEYVGKSALASGGTAYVMGALRQQVAGITLRMDYSITPDLSIRFYGNPFISTGKYSEFKRATNTVDRKYSNRFDLLDDDVLVYHADDKKYSATDAAGGKYSFSNPDFSFREFRFNLVMRWEYRPNSVVYLVWAQNRSGRANDYLASFGRNTQALFDYVPDNTLMLKLNYWFSL
jgi:hypothetical protein